MDSLEKLKARLPKLHEELDDPTKFRDFYQFTFQYAKSISKRSLDLETAVAYWELIFAGADSRIDVWVCLLNILDPEIHYFVFFMDIFSKRKF